MKVQIYFFGNFRSMAGRPEQIIDLAENSSVRDLLDYLINQYSKMTGFLSSEHIRNAHVLVTLRDKPVRNYETILSEGDQLYLFIVLTGG